MNGDAAIWLLMWSVLASASEGGADSRPAAAVGPTTLVVEAQSYYDNGRYLEARTAAESFIREYKDDPRCRLMRFIRAASLVQLGQTEDGGKVLEAAIAENPELKNRPDVQELLADALSGIFDRRLEAERCYRAAAAALESQRDTDPAAAVWVKLADLYLRHDRWPAGSDAKVPDTRPEQLKVLRALVLAALDRAAQLSQTPLAYGSTQLLRARFLAGRIVPDVVEIDAALAAYDDVLNKAGQTDVAPNALYESASILDARSLDFVEAAWRYEQLLRQFPRFPQRDDAELSLYRIRRPLLILRAQEVILPGGQPLVHWRARNVRRLALTAHKVDLFDLLQEIGDPQHLTKWQGGREVARWDADLPDDGRHRYLSSEDAGAAAIRVPLRDSGAYVIEAAAEGVKARVLVMISGLRAVAKDGRSGSVVWIVDARTGQPVAGAEVMAQRSEGPRGYSYETGRTDTLGLWTSSPASEAGTSRSLTTAVHRGDDYALLNQSFHWRWWGYQRPLRAYGFTDQPVYEPGRTVHYKEIVRTFSQGRYGNWPAKGLKILVRDPRGEVVHEKAATTSEFGVVRGSFELASGVRPGLHQIELILGSQTYGPKMTGANEFLVVSSKDASAPVTPSVEEPVAAGGQEPAAGSSEQAGADLTLKLAGRSFRPGERAEVAIASQHSDAVVWLTAEADDLLFSRIVRLDNGTAIAEIPIDMRYAPNFHLCAAAVRQNEVLEACTQVCVPPVEQLLSVSLQTDRASMGAGERAELRILANDHQGRPVKAEVTVCLVDVGVCGAWGPIRQPVESFFHGDQRPRLVRTSTGHEYFQTGAGPGRKPGGDVQPATATRLSAATRPAGRPASAPTGRDRVAVSAPVALPVPRDFAPSGVWLADVWTATDGTAMVAVNMPAARRTWRVTAIAIDERTRVGQAALDLTTRE